MDKLIETEGEVTPAVLEVMNGADNPRLREVMASLITHLHAFLREVRPTEQEYEFGLSVLNSIGQATNESHNEAVLYADILGASTLIDLINNDGMQGETMSALLGPFYRGQAPNYEYGDSIARCEMEGTPLTLEGRVIGLGGQPLANAMIDVWQASPRGMYENQDPDQDDYNLRGIFHTDAQGRYLIRTVKPAGYPVPMHTPAGDLLRAQNRSPYRPAHVHFIVSAPEHKTLITQIFSDSMDNLLSDVVFGVKPQITGELVEKGDGSFTCAYDFVLKPGNPSFPVPPISGKAQ